MKSYLLPALALGLLVSSVSAQDEPDLTNPKLRASYALGTDLVSGLDAEEMGIDTKALAAGVLDKISGKLSLTPEEITDALDKLKADLMAKAAVETAKHANGTNNLKEGEAFLADNKKKDGVKVKPVTLADGTKAELQYKIIKSGTGEMPKKTSTVKVHYHGTLVDGTVFDSSVKRGEPVTFPVNGVIPGWVEALQMMKVGDKWQLFIPAKLAYGDKSQGPKIGPNSTLIFEVELLAVPKP